MNLTKPIIESHWALSWACSVLQEEPSIERVERSQEANEVFRLRLTESELFLKVGPNLESEYERLKWLEGTLPAPRAIDFVRREGIEAILMTAIGGQDLADLCGSLPPETIVERLASSLQTIHTTRVADWPFGGSGTLVHGDACLPNFLYSDDRLAGYIDVGELDLADPQVDLAAAIWSLQYNLGKGWGLPFLREYGIVDADEEVVERLRLSYTGSSEG